MGIYETLKKYWRQDTRELKMMCSYWSREHGCMIWYAGDMVQEAKESNQPTEEVSCVEA